MIEDWKGSRETTLNWEAILRWRPVPLEDGENWELITA
jgi:hypothetical protein